MATQKVNPLAWDSPANWTGFLTNVDEPVASADGSVVSHESYDPFIGDPVIFDFFDVGTTPDATDGDTVTSVTVTVRAKVDTLTYNPDLRVTLLIGGVSQGQVIDATVGTSFSNIVFTDPGWDQDWTAAQLATAQVRIVGRKDTRFQYTTYSIDCIDLDVTYTVNTYEIPVAATSLSTAGQAPGDVIVTEDFVVRYPGAGSATIQGRAPGIGESVSPGAGALGLAGKPSYLNSLTERLQVNGWDSGWPTGFLANIDEPVVSADGSTISTSGPSDTVTLSLDDTSLVETDTVLSVGITVRAATSDLLGATTLEVELVVGGVSQGTEFISTLITTQSNFVLSNESWDQDWTVAELDSMQVRITHIDVLLADAVSYLDTLDVVVEYAPQTPIERTPAADALALSGQAPTLFYERFIAPAIDALALGGQTPELRRTFNLRPFEAQRMLNAKTPIRRTDFYRLPGVGSATLTGKTPVKTVNFVRAPGAESLALSGQTPVVDAVDDHVRSAATGALTLSPEAPLVPVTDAHQFIVPRTQRALTGKTPIASTTLNLWEDPGVGSLALAGTVTTLPGSIVRTPAVGTLSLSMQLPLRSEGRVLTPGGTSLTLAGPVPFLGLLPDELVLAGQAPLLSATYSVPGTTLALTGSITDVLVSATKPETAALTLTGQAGPTIELSTALTPGQPGLISLSVDYGIEFIATPADILIT